MPPSGFSNLLSVILSLSKTTHMMSYDAAACCFGFRARNARRVKTGAASRSDFCLFGARGVPPREEEEGDVTEEEEEEGAEGSEDLRFLDDFLDGIEQGLRFDCEISAPAQYGLKNRRGST